MGAWIALCSLQSTSRIGSAHVNIAKNVTSYHPRLIRNRDVLVTLSKCILSLSHNNGGSLKLCNRLLDLISGVVNTQMLTETVSHVSNAL